MKLRRTVKAQSLKKKEKERNNNNNNNNNNCRGIGPRNSLSTSILGPNPKPRTRVVRGGKNTIKGTHISERPSRSGL